MAMKSKKVSAVASDRFELTDETRKVGGTTVYRIRAKKTFKTGRDGMFTVKKGDAGGFVSDAGRILGNAWVMGDAVVMDRAIVGDNALVSGTAIVRGRVAVYGNAHVGGCSRVSGFASVCEYAMVDGNSRVSDHAFVSGWARVLDNAQVRGKTSVGSYADVKDRAVVVDTATVGGHAHVYGRSMVMGNSWVVGDAKICDDVRVCGEAYVHGRAELTGDAVVKSFEDFSVYLNTWSSGRYVTYTRSNGMWRAGCFHGTGEELAAKARLDGKLSGKCYAELVKFQKRIDALRERFPADRERDSKEDAQPVSL